MNRHPLVSVAAIVLFVAVVSLASLAGQENEYIPQRTPWGDPDLRGYYLPGTAQPMETPASGAVGRHRVFRA